MSKGEKYAFNGNKRQYMIALYRWRSITALAACAVTLFVTLYAVFAGFAANIKGGYPAFELFQYFTTDSNLLTAVGAGMIIPFAVEGIRRKRFTYPKWVAMIHYSGTICTTLTMVFALSIISWYDFDMAFRGHNFYLHIICPLTVLISFFLVESGYRYTVKDAFLCLIPFLTYAAVYAVNVVFIGAENGGWEDIYHLTDIIPAAFSMILMFILVTGITLFIRYIYNRAAAFRTKQLTALWSEDAEAVEIKIELFGLGRYMGLHEDERYAFLPMDIIEMLAERYDLKTEELARAYLRGHLDGAEQRRSAKRKAR